MDAILSCARSRCPGQAATWRRWNGGNFTCCKESRRVTHKTGLGCGAGAPFCVRTTLIQKQPARKNMFTPCETRCNTHTFSEVLKAAARACVSTTAKYEIWSSQLGVQSCSCKVHRYIHELVTAFWTMFSTSYYEAGDFAADVRGC